jgi:hypothetical protein
MLFVVAYQGGSRGCPVVLKGDLNNDWEWDEHDPDPPNFSVTSEY